MCPGFDFMFNWGFCMKSRCFCLIRNVIIVVDSSYRFPRFGHCRCCYRLLLPHVVVQLTKPHLPVNQNPVLSRGLPRLHTPLSWPVITCLCRGCLALVCPTKASCRKGACCKAGDPVTDLCGGMAAHACYKPTLQDKILQRGVLMQPQTRLPFDSLLQPTLAHRP